MDKRLADLRGNLEKLGQSHLLKFVSKLTEDEKKELCEEIDHFNIPEVNRYFGEAQKSMSESSEKKDDRLEPLPREICGSTLSDGERVSAWESRGLAAIAEDKVTSEGVSGRVRVCLVE